MYGNDLVPKKATTGKSERRKLNKLLRELSDEESAGECSNSAPGSDPSKPWLQDFNSYLNSQDHLGDKPTVTW
jgi:hypothetical protein